MVSLIPLLVCGLLSVAPTAVRSACECGYEDDNGHVWQEAQIVPFDKLKSLNASADYYSPLRTINSTNPNTRPRTYPASNTALTANGQLALTLPGGQQDAAIIRSAEIETRRSDYLFGTFRTRMKVPSVSGAVAAFFFYADDSHEIDIEILTRELPTRDVRYTIQPVQYQADNTEDPRTTVAKPVDFDPSADFHNWRFDWTPDAVNYFVDDALHATLNTNVPLINGSLLLNNWGNANPAWTGTPPSTDAVMLVISTSYFFNSSNATAVASYELRCAGAAGTDRVCPIESVDPTALYGTSEVYSSGVWRAPTRVPVKIKSKNTAAKVVSNWGAASFWAVMVLANSLAC